MKFKYLIPLFFLFLVNCNAVKKKDDLPHVIISTDIGGSDPDDYQSLIHLLVYADRFHIQGLISSSPGQGRKEHIEEVLYAYAQDYENLKRKSGGFPEPGDLLKVTKQGAENPQEAPIPQALSEGAAWMIKKAREINSPLYILVWGSMTDVAQAVHKEPGIKRHIRIYSIGSWNTQQDPKARDYLYHNHQDLWWIENNTTFRGMYMGGYQEEDYHNLTFVEDHVKNHGELGKLFWEKKNAIKMGDTPSVLYLLNGNPEDPEGESWGGSFRQTGHGEFYWTDKTDKSLVENGRKGAKTVNKFRRDFLEDWAKRMEWTLNRFGSASIME